MVGGSFAVRCGVVPTASRGDVSRSCLRAQGRRQGKNGSRRWLGNTVTNDLYYPYNNKSDASNWQQTGCAVAKSGCAANVVVHPPFGRPFQGAVPRQTF